MRWLRRGAWTEILVVSVVATHSLASDWPMYRADAARTGYSSDPLPAELALRWKHRGPVPRPAWPASSRITYDFANQPIIARGLVLFGSSADDRLIALDLKTGKLRWEFFVGGPVRFAPVAWRDRVFVASDDGCLYSVSLLDGKLLWRHRGGPDNRLSLGNGRVVSRWPARGGPVVVDDTIYYAAGIWPSDGVYVHALDPLTGKVKWTNDSTGRALMPQPHGGAEAYSGVAPQGYLTASADLLFVPTGRAVPAAFRRSDGVLEHYLLQENGSMGGSRALFSEGFVINGGCFLDGASGRLAARAGRGVVGVMPDGILQFDGSQLIAYGWDEIPAKDGNPPVPARRVLRRQSQMQLAEASEDMLLAANAAEALPNLKKMIRAEIMFRDTDPTVEKQTGLERIIAQARPMIEDLGASIGPFLAGHYERSNELIGVGREAVCGTSDKLRVVDLESGKTRWSANVEGAALGLAAAEGALIVSTTSGALYCFGDNVAASDTVAPSAPVAPASAGESPGIYRELAKRILKDSGITSGICVDLGCGEGDLALELARQSRLQVIGFESEAAKVNIARRQIAAAGLYGERVTILEGDPGDTGCPRYSANLVVSSRNLLDASAAPKSTEVARLQRPWGGVACLGFRDNLTASKRGPLDGAGSWTHQNSNPANTLCSDDTLVRGPLEMAWYRDDEIEIPDRHAQAPAPLFVRGMLVVMGVDGVCGLDAYNGQTRWVRPMAGILKDWDGVHHDVGVGDVGSNFCLGDDCVFVRDQDRCLKLDLQTGETLAEFKAPSDPGSEDKNWGHVAHEGGLLFGSVLNSAHAVSPRYGAIRMRTESVKLFAMDASTGQLRWEHRPRHSIRNNTIAITRGRVYLIDRPLAPQDRITDPKPNRNHRKVLQPGEHPGGTLIALDASSGRVVWTNADDIFGTQLAVSPKHSILLMYYQGVKHTFFKLPSEIGGRIAAFRAASGERIWDRAATYKTRPIINGATIYAEGGAWDLRTGEPIPWDFKRSYGCGQIASGAHTMLFRSATLGYLDLTRDAGTENFGGIRPSCWFNAIPAGGMVLVPDGSSKCACSYQQQAWLALQPPE